MRYSYEVSNIKVWEIKVKTLPSFFILQTGIQVTLDKFPPKWVSI